MDHVDSSAQGFVETDQDRGALSVPGPMLRLDWSRYRLKAEVVAREIASLKPCRFVEIAMPPVAPCDFTLLLDSVQANGVYEPLVVSPAGLVVDGHARLRAAEIARVHQVPTRVLEADGGEEDYALWAAVANIGRRHLTAGQRFTLVKAVLDVLEKQVRARQDAARLRRSEAPADVSESASPKLDSPRPRADVRAEIGALVGMSRSQAAKMVKIIKDGPAALQDEVAAGRMSVHRAHERVRRRGVAEAPRRPEDAGTPASIHRDLAADPVRTLRILAGLIAEWAQLSLTWEAAGRAELMEAVHNVEDSCELFFRRVSAGAGARLSG